MIRKHNGVYKLPIKKHTKVKRPVSKYRIGISYYNTYTHDLDLVQDICGGLENPLSLKPVDFNLSNMLIICKNSFTWRAGSVNLTNTEMYGEPKKWRMKVIKAMLTYHPLQRIKEWGKK